MHSACTTCAPFDARVMQTGAVNAACAPFVAKGLMRAETRSFAEQVKSCFARESGRGTVGKTSKGEWFYDPHTQIGIVEHWGLWACGL